MKPFTTIAAPQEVKMLNTGVRSTGLNFYYNARSFQSNYCGALWLLISLQDVNGKAMELELYSSPEGCFE